MKPLGRRHFKDKTGSKHKYKFKGKTESWWDDVVSPNKTRFNRQGLQEVAVEVEDYLSRVDLYGDYSVLEDIDYRYKPCDLHLTKIHRHNPEECIYCAYEDELELRKEMGFENNWSDHFEWWDFVDYWERNYG